MGEGEFTSKGTLVTTVGGETTGIGPNPNRVALVVSTDQGAFSTYIVATGAPDNTHRIYVGNQSPVYLTYRDHGPIVGYGWNVGSTGAGLTVSMVELTCLAKGGT